MAIELFNVLSLGAARLSITQTVTAPDDDGVAQIPLPLDVVTESHGGFTVDPVNATLVIPSDGHYRVPFGLNARYSGELNFYLVVNGTRLNSVPLALQGRGSNRPVAIYWSNIVPLSEGDQVQLMMAGYGGSISVEAAHAHFSAAYVGS